MTPFAAIVRATVQQFMGRSRFIGFAILSLIPAGLFAAAARARDVEGIDTDLGAMLVTPFFTIVLPITALILASSALGDERRDKTLSFIVLRPISRLEIAAAKAVAACIASVGFALLGAVALCLTYVAVGGRLDVLPSIVVGAALACVLYSSIFVLLGNVVARPTLIGVLYVLFVENLLAAELPRLSGASPWRVGLGATIDLMPATFPARALLGALGELVPSLGNALIATGVTAAITVGICAVLLTRVDSV